LFWISQAIDELIPIRTEASIAAKERLFEGGPIPNIILGFSGEDQQRFNERWKYMHGISACGFTTMCSFEPLLGPIDASIAMFKGKGSLSWAIVGGESGPGARPMHPDWARGLRDQCRASGVPFFYKQHGEWISLVDYDPFVHGFKPEAYPHKFAWKAGVENNTELPISCYRVGKKSAGALLDGREWREFPHP
jgi:hypothetical protein